MRARPGRPMPTTSALAFQIVDDLLDVEGDAAETRQGDRQGRRGRQGDASCRSSGVERARAQADLLAARRPPHLEPFGERADLLKQAANFVVARRA